ncbi:MAG: hypothetical protein H0S82_06350 [Anaerolineaceae bacterium]|nr:hypothetical protein [Anaerolineaceae bacterium]
MEKISYGGWDNCYRLSNGIVDLVVTGDVGPRIIRFGFLEKENMFKEFADQMGRTTAKEWMNFGGHRLWHAPEAVPRTYYIDIEPVLIQEIENGLVATQKPEPTTGLQKQITIILSPDKPVVQVNHTLINHNQWLVQTAPWALSVMAPGGVGIVTLPPRGPHPEFMLPTSTLSIWPYTDLSDQRWVFGKRYLLLKQDPANPAPQKIGIYATDGWAAYANMNALFVKQAPLQYGEVYPDLGANFELFTNDEILEVESLGPIDSIPPKGQISHLETWTLYDNVPQPENEEDVIRDIVPLLK